MSDQKSGSSFLSGFFGCFGVLAAIILCVLLLGFCAVAGSTKKAGRIADGTEKEGSAFIAHCALGLRMKGQIDPAWAGANLALTTPEIRDETPPQVIACGAILRSGQAAAFRVQAICSDGLQGQCVSLAD